MGTNHSHNSSKNIGIAFFLNVAFTIFEIFGGIWTNSMAILSDAVHDLGDSLSLGLSWYLDRKSKKKGDMRFSFGYQRFSLLGALINGLVLTSGSIYILTQAIPRLIKPEHSDAKGMLVFAIVGILVNGAAAMRLIGGKTINERMVSWHLIEDVLGWVAVLIVSIILLFWDIHILDPILSIIILSYVLFNVIKNLRETFLVFLQGVPSELDLNSIISRMSEINRVVSVHHAHIWSLDGEKHVLTIHLVIQEVNSVKAVIDIKNKAKVILRLVPINHATIEIEFEDETCYMSESEKLNS